MSTIRASDKQVPRTDAQLRRRQAEVLASRRRLAQAGIARSAEGEVGHTDGVARQHSSRRTVRLRTRVTLFFSLATLLASLSLGVVTYLVARSYLLDQRESVAKSQAFLNAKSVRDELAAPLGDVGQLVAEQLRTESGGFAIVLMPTSEAISTDFRFTSDVLPRDLLASVRGRQSGVQRFDLFGEP